MGNQLPYYCLRCFRDSSLVSERQQTEVIVYSPPSESPIGPSPRPTQNSSVELEKVREINDVEEGMKLRETDSGYNITEIRKTLESAWLGLLSLVKTDAMPILVHKADVQVFGRETPRGFCLKTVWTVQQSSHEFVRFVRRFGLRPSWDCNLEVGTLAAELQEGIVVNYQKFKKVMAVSARDMLVACKTMQSGSPTVEVSVSVNSEDYPQSSDIVRIKQFIGGYFLEPLESGATRVTAVSEMDFGGAIPRSFIMKMSAMAMPKFVKSLTDALSAHSTDLFLVASH